jgi:hypothetical protein
MRKSPQHKGFSVRRRELLGFDPMASSIPRREGAAETTKL